MREDRATADVVARVRAVDPARPGPAGAPGARLDDRAEAELDRILAGLPGPLTAQLGTGAEADRRRARTVPRRVAVAALTVAVLGTGVTVAGRDGLLGGSSGTARATPPLLVVEPVSALRDQGLPVAEEGQDAAGLLDALADRVEDLPDDTGTGPATRVSTEGWYLWTRVDGRQVDGAIVVVSDTTWTAADGSRVSERRVGDRTPERLDLPATESMWGPDPLSSDPEVLAGQLELAHPTANGPAERLVSVTDLFKDRPVPPLVRAAVLRYVAETPGLVLTGAVHDRRGRPGVAVSVESAMSGLPTRYTLVLDPRTGALLGDEQVLTEDAGALDVAVPSVIAYTTYLEAVRVADVP